MPVFLLSFVWDQRTVMFKHSGCYSTFGYLHTLGMRPFRVPSSAAASKAGGSRYGSGTTTTTAYGMQESW